MSPKGFFHAPVALPSQGHKEWVIPKLRFDDVYPLKSPFENGDNLKLTDSYVATIIFHSFPFPKKAFQR